MVYRDHLMEQLQSLYGASLIWSISLMTEVGSFSRSICRRCHLGT
jgi:hypothetical protein